MLRSTDSADEPVADGLSSEDDEWSNAGTVLRGRQYGSCGVKVASLRVRGWGDYMVILKRSFITQRMIKSYVANNRLPGCKIK